MSVSSLVPLHSHHRDLQLPSLLESNATGFYGVERGLSGQEHLMFF